MNMTQDMTHELLNNSRIHHYVNRSVCSTLVVVPAHLTFSYALHSVCTANNTIGPPTSYRVFNKAIVRFPYKWFRTLLFILNTQVTTCTCTPCCHSHKQGIMKTPSSFVFLTICLLHSSHHQVFTVTIMAPSTLYMFFLVIKAYQNSYNPTWQLASNLEFNTSCHTYHLLCGVYALSSATW